MKKQLKNKIEALKTGWYIWLFPAFAVLISAWLIFDYYKQQGPVVQIYFDDANGIQAEKTKVKFRGVAIGTVKDIYISEDQKDVIAKIILRKDAKHFAVEGSRFSLVTPKVNLQGISGLETLFEGTYISVLPGDTDGKKKSTFKAVNTSATDPLDDTSPYILETNSVESIGVGNSVTFRGLKIGSVTKINLSKEGQALLVQVNVENKYVRLIRVNTVFWRKIGVQAKVGLFNAEFKMNSLDSIMNGGVELASPAPAQPMAKAGQRFPLLNAPPKDWEKWNPVLAAD